MTQFDLADSVRDSRTRLVMIAIADIRQDERNVGSVPIADIVPECVSFLWDDTCGMTHVCTGARTCIAGRHPFFRCLCCNAGIERNPGAHQAAGWRAAAV